MRRIAMLLSLVGLMTVGLAALPGPAQAHEGWRWGHHHWRHHHGWWAGDWRWHHQYWYPRYYRYGYYTPYAYYYTPGVSFGFSIY